MVKMRLFWVIFFLVLTIGYPILLLCPIRMVKLRNELKVFFYRTTFPTAVLCIIINYDIWLKNILDFKNYVLLVGILLGWICANISCSVVNKFNDVIIIPIKVFFDKKSIYDLGKILIMCMIEEILWRNIIWNYFYTNALVCNILEILIISLLFTLSHFHSHIKYIQLMDLFIFSLILCCLFNWLGSLWLVIIIHFVRNVFIDSLREGKKYD